MDQTERLLKERRVTALQRRISIVPHLLAERNQLLDELNAAGVTQASLAERLSKAASSVAGSPLTEDAVQKAIRQHRETTVTT